MSCYKEWREKQETFSVLHENEAQFKKKRKKKSVAA